MAPLDQAFRALADHRRRRLLLAIRDTSGETGAVTVPEDVVDGGGVSDRLVLRYDHVHLPMLEDWGYIKWDRRRDQVAEGPRFDQLRPVLEVAEEYGGSTAPPTP
jgi:hypothetical protein